MSKMLWLLTDCRHKFTRYIREIFSRNWNFINRCVVLHFFLILLVILCLWHVVVRVFVLCDRARSRLHGHGHKARVKHAIWLTGKFRCRLWLWLHKRIWLHFLVIVWLDLDFDVNFLLPIAVSFLADAVLTEIDFVNGFGSGVVDPCFLGCFRYVHSLLVNERN